MLTGLRRWNDSLGETESEHSATVSAKAEEEAVIGARTSTDAREYDRSAVVRADDVKLHDDSSETTTGNPVRDSNFPFSPFLSLPFLHRPSPRSYLEPSNILNALQKH